MATELLGDQNNQVENQLRALQESGVVRLQCPECQSWFEKKSLEISSLVRASLETPEMQKLLVPYLAEQYSRFYEQRQKQTHKK